MKPYQTKNALFQWKLIFDTAFLYELWFGQKQNKAKMLSLRDMASIDDLQLILFWLLLFWLLIASILLSIFIYWSRFYINVFFPTYYWFNSNQKKNNSRLLIDWFFFSLCNGSFKFSVCVCVCGCMKWLVIELNEQQQQLHTLKFQIAIYTHN